MSAPQLLENVLLSHRCPQQSTRTGCRAQFLLSNVGARCAQHFAGKAASGGRSLLSLATTFSFAEALC